MIEIFTRESHGPGEYLCSGYSRRAGYPVFSALARTCIASGTPARVTIQHLLRDGSSSAQEVRLEKRDNRLIHCYNITMFVLAQLVRCKYCALLWLRVLCSIPQGCTYYTVLFAKLFLHPASRLYTVSVALKAFLCEALAVRFSSSVEL